MFVDFQGLTHACPLLVPVERPALKIVNVA
jgi:hypothetical protein